MRRVIPSASSSRHFDAHNHPRSPLGLLIHRDQPRPYPSVPRHTASLSRRNQSVYVHALCSPCRKQSVCVHGTAGYGAARFGAESAAGWGPGARYRVVLAISTRRRPRGSMGCLENRHTSPLANRSDSSLSEPTANATGPTKPSGANRAADSVPRPSYRSASCRFSD